VIRQLTEEKKAKQTIKEEVESRINTKQHRLAWSLILLTLSSRRAVEVVMADRMHTHPAVPVNPLVVVKTRLFAYQ
jgi:hypothetical protein